MREEYKPKHTHANVVSQRGEQKGRENPSEYEGLFAAKICRQSTAYLRRQLRRCVCVCLCVCGHLCNQSSSSTTIHSPADTFTTQGGILF